MNSSNNGDKEKKEKTKKEYSAKELFGNNNEIIINYKKEQYRLRITKNEKLVMNK